LIAIKASAARRRMLISARWWRRFREGFVSDNIPTGQDPPSGSIAVGPVSPLQRWLPGLHTAGTYKLSWLPHDLVAGLVLSAMLVPVGIAYAVASGVPGIYGLYATIVPLLAYALFGPSRIMVLGPDSSLATLILATILPLSAGDPARAVALAGMTALISGLILILSGLCRLGFITELLSKPIRYGYMNGIALTVIVSQLPKLLEVSIDSTGPLHDLAAIAGSVLSGKANATAFAIGAGSLAVILALKRWTRFSGILVAVVGSTFTVGLLRLDESGGIKVLGTLPQGLPAFTIPWIGLGDLGAVIIGAAAIAVVSFADTSVLSRTYAARTRTSVDPNQEMIGLGAA
jgi:MFS superfamily sulfate permease-like transporter